MKKHTMKKHTMKKKVVENEQEQYMIIKQV